MNPEQAVQRSERDIIITLRGLHVLIQGHIVPVFVREQIQLPCPYIHEAPVVTFVILPAGVPQLTPDGDLRAWRKKNRTPWGNR